MAEIPEHLLRRSADRRKALAGGEGGDDAPADAAPADAAPAAEDASAAVEAAAPAAAEAEDTGTPITESKGGVPAHLLERARKRKAAAAGGGGEGGGAVATATAAKGPAMTAGAPTGSGPGGHTQRLLTVVKAGSIQQTKAEAQDKVHTWPHLLAVEFAATMIMLAMITIFSALVKAPLLGLADINKTPNPSKAPWYFLGLQELLTMFHPMVAGVTIPGVALGILAIAPYVDKNPSNKPSDRKFAISMMTLFLMLWAVLVIIGSFFRGEGFNFVFPWNNHVFFEL